MSLAQENKLDAYVKGHINVTSNKQVSVVACNYYRCKMILTGRQIVGTNGSKGSPSNSTFITTSTPY